MLKTKLLTTQLKVMQAIDYENVMPEDRADIANMLCSIGLDLATPEELAAPTPPTAKKATAPTKRGGPLYFAGALSTSSRVRLRKIRHIQTTNPEYAGGFDTGPYWEFVESRNYKQVPLDFLNEIDNRIRKAMGQRPYNWQRDEDREECARQVQAAVDARKEPFAVMVPEYSPPKNGNVAGKHVFDEYYKKMEAANG